MYLFLTIFDLKNVDNIVIAVYLLKMRKTDIFSLLFVQVTDHIPVQPTWKNSSGAGGTQTSKMNTSKCVTYCTRKISDI